MYQTPSRKKRLKKAETPNLIPILDAIFIFIFFLLLSANFMKIYQINSEVPIYSTQQPEKPDKDPLALTMELTKDSTKIFTGVPKKLQKSFKHKEDGEPDLYQIHNYLVGLKKQNRSERDVIITPKRSRGYDPTYETIVNLMDAVRMMRKSDDPIYIKKNGIDIQEWKLFDRIVFGNIKS